MKFFADLWQLQNDEKCGTKLWSGSRAHKILTSSKKFIKDQFKILHHGKNTPYNLELVSKVQLDPTLMTRKFKDQFKILHQWPKYSS
jgi:hypothetical protein